MQVRWDTGAGLSEPYIPFQHKGRCSRLSHTLNFLPLSSGELSISGKRFKVLLLAPLSSHCKSWGLTQGCHSCVSTIPAGPSCSVKWKSCAVFRAASYTTENVGYSLYFYNPNPLYPVTWFLINKQWKISLPCSGEDVQQVLWMLQLNCGNHGVLQLWNIVMFTH